MSTPPPTAGVRVDHADRGADRADAVRETGEDGDRVRARRLHQVVDYLDALAHLRSSTARRGSLDRPAHRPPGGTACDDDAGDTAGGPANRTGLAGHLRARIDAGEVSTPLAADLVEAGGAAPAPDDLVAAGESRPLFPLPTNPEQRAVFEHLRRRHGVLVQGPPGTGKTHTIANLVTHLIASDLRVLVTAKSGGALRVLHEMLPPEVRPLCVAATSRGAAEPRDLEESVRALTDRYARLDPPANARRTRELERRLRRTEAEEAELRGRWLFARRAEGTEIDLGDGWRGTPAAIGRRLREEAPTTGWLDDDVPADSVIDLPRTAAALGRLLRGEATGRATTLAEDDRSGTAPAVNDDAAGEIGDLEVVAGLPESLARADAFVATAMEDALTGDDARWREWIAAMERRLDGLLERARRADCQHLDCGGRIDLRTLLQAANDAHARAQAPRRFLGLRTRARSLDHVRIDGRRGSDPEALPALLENLETRRDVALCWRTLAGLVPRPDGPLSTQVAAAAVAVERLEDGLTRAGRAREAVARRTGRPCRGLDDALGVAADCRAALARRAEVRAATQRERDLAVVEATLPRLAAAITSETLDVRVSAAELPRALAFARARTWHDAHLARHDEVALHQRMTRLEDRRRQLTGELAAARGFGHLLARMTETQRRHLVAWRQTMAELATRASRRRTRSREVDADVAQLRRDARRHLAGCQAAIGAWILPLDQVFETLAADVDAFDVVIVDEASQCGQEALPLLMMARRLLVVGDPQQIRPIPVGVANRDIEELQERHLAEFEHRDAFDPRRSLLDHAALRFDAVVTLREHFRCLPEIIRFSDELCYGDAPLLALRRPTRRRLPPLRARHVPDGARTGAGADVVNLREAEAVATSIRECLDDPAYHGLSFGVIAMQGSGQARAIERALGAKVSAAEAQARRLVCGTPYGFQGDERDVMWISLVAAPNERNAPLVRDDFVRRFNVAMSRARDQVWLVHSVLPEDLSPHDLRRRLLEHVLHGPIGDGASAATGGSGRSLEEVLDPTALAHDVAFADRSIADPPEPFDTWLEADVAVELLRDGYRVVPRDISGDRLPVTVEDGDRLLAIECADERLAPEEAARRLERRLLLERCGWSFFAVRSSERDADPDRVTRELREALEDRGLRPDPRRRDAVATHGPDPRRRDAVATHGPEAREEREERGGEPAADPPTHAGRQPQNLAEDPVRRGETTPATHELVDGDLYLEPHASWDERPLPAPRADDLRPLADALVEIVEAEGPVVVARIQRRYAAAAGVDGPSPGIDVLLDEALRRAVDDGRLVVLDEPGDPALQTLRTPAQPDVLPRTRGDRSFLEIPPREVVEVLDFVERSRPRMSVERVHRSVLAVFDVADDGAEGPARRRLRAIDAGRPDARSSAGSSDHPAAAHAPPPDRLPPRATRSAVQTARGWVDDADADADDGADDRLGR